MTDFEAFQKQFRAFLGSEPEQAIEYLAEKTGYSKKYLLWVAGLIGQKPWPGSHRFVRRMAKLGCSDRPWRDRKPKDLARALEQRQILFDPLEAKK